MSLHTTGLDEIGGGDVETGFVSEGETSLFGLEYLGVFKIPTGCVGVTNLALDIISVFGDGGSAFVAVSVATTDEGGISFDFPRPIQDSIRFRVCSTASSSVIAVNTFGSCDIDVFFDGAAVAVRGLRTFGRMCRAVVTSFSFFMMQ
jgi:hypothetical protein